MTPPPLTPPIFSPAPKKILIIRPSALGDVCRSVPVLASLRLAYPEAQIDWLVQDSFAPAIAAHPALSNVVPFPRGKFAEWYKPSIAPQLKQFMDGLAAAKYDLVLDCQGLFRSGMFAMATRAPKRVGFENAAELGWIGLTDRVPAPKSLHAVDRMMLLAEACGAKPVFDLRLYTHASDRAWAESHSALREGRYAVLAPTTRWPGKLWPADRFARLAEVLLETFALDRVVIVGSESERGQVGDLLAKAESDPRVVDFMGKTSVGQLMATIERSSLVVGCDSAAVHMGVGFGRPMAALYGPTRVERVGPYGRSAHVVQRLIPGDVRDHKDEEGGRVLMNRISVEDVIEVIAGQLGRAATPP